MSLTRKGLVLFALAISLVATACSSDGSGTDTANGGPVESADGNGGASGEDFAPGVLDSGATIASFDQGSVQVHTYTNTEAGFGNSTTVIETENSVVLIDAHFGVEPASEFRAFAESFGKPIERLILTHEHPDHIGGVGPVFGDVDSFSSAGVVSAAAEAGTTITNTLTSGEVEIDGVQFVFDVYEDAEAEEQVVIRVPDAGLIAAGDLV